MTQPKPFVAIVALVSFALTVDAQSRENDFVPPLAWELAFSDAGVTPTSFKEGSILKVTGSPPQILNEISGNRLASLGNNSFALNAALMHRPTAGAEKGNASSENPTRESLAWRKLPGPGIIRFVLPEGVEPGILVVVNQEGEEVRQLRPMGNSDAILWDGRNRSGQKMAAGVYRAEHRSHGSNLSSWVLLSD